LFDGLTSLFLISGLFGLFQGGIVPMYAILVRDYFPPREAGTRLGIVLMATLFGMALGGWMSGFIFDLTGSYRAAFMNGLAWNMLNLLIVAWLLLRPRARLAHALLCIRNCIRRLSSRRRPPLALRGNPQEGQQDARPRPCSANQTARYFRASAAATIVVDWDFQNAQSVCRCSHLHFQIPAIAQF